MIKNYTTGAVYAALNSGGEYNGELLFTATEASTVKIQQVGSPSAVSVTYSKNQGKWTAYTIGDIISLAVGDTIAWKNDGSTWSSGYSNCYKFVMTGKLAGSGSVMSLINFGSLSSYCFCRLFQSCASLTTAPELPATTLVDHCYYYMFCGCTSLTTIRVPFTDWLASSYVTSDWVYNVSSTGTFYCSSELEIKNGTSYIPSGWTVKCTDFLKLTATEASTVKITKSGSPSAVELQYRKNSGDWTDYTVDDVINLVTGDYIEWKNNVNTFSTSYSDYYQFVMTGKMAGSGNLNSLINNASLSNYCFRYLFKNCTSLTTAPNLPATTLANNCYQYMFNGCTALTTAPTLSATTLANSCYYSMFEGCTALTTAPSLPATTLANYCYQQMFYNCTSLTTAPSLPATTLATYCYSSMFYGCTNLTTAPQLPSTTLADGCYEYMFYSCSSLTTAPKLPADTLVNRCYYYMFYECTSLTSIQALFTSWDVYQATSQWVYNVSSTGTFTCVDNLTETYGTNNIPTGWTVVKKSPLKMTATEASTFKLTYGYSVTPDLYYRINGGTWTAYSNNTVLSLATDDYIELWNHGSKWNGTASRYYEGNHRFTLTGKLNLSGDVMSLLNYGDLYNYCFYVLFASCSSIVDASALSLSATVLKAMCYSNMFDGCTSLTTAPSVLPATTLTAYCYQSMFQDCTSLTTAPSLPATTLASKCYSYMFNRCTNLSSITVAFTSWDDGYDRTDSWMSGVQTNSGTFRAPTALPDQRGYRFIPENWTLVRTDASSSSSINNDGQGDTPVDDGED